MTAWDDRIDARPDAARAELEALLAAPGSDDAAVLFERASLHDFLGEEEAAIPLYCAALDAGLDARRRPRAVIQLASSLRNTGDAVGALRALDDVTAADELASAAAAFRALALHDAGRHGEALRTALGALAPTLPLYRRAVAAYADELDEDPSSTARPGGGSAT